MKNQTNAERAAGYREQATKAALAYLRLTRMDYEMAAKATLSAASYLNEKANDLDPQDQDPY